MNNIYNIKIGEIEKEIVSSDIIKPYSFSNYDVLCVNAPMGSGKTKNIHNLVNKYKNIIFVTFRVTLINQLSKNFKKFIKYSEIEEKVINLDIYSKVITTIDSLHRIVGECDLLIIDEFTYTLSHLTDYVKEREMVYSTLTQYLNNNNTKVLALDALMNENDIEFLKYFKNNIKYIKYENDTHSNKKIINYNNNLGLFFNKVIKDIENNKKIYICSNSKSHILFYENILKNKFSGKKISCITSDNAEFFDIDDWDDSDIVLYSPSITAGISYEKKRFDTCYGFFINISAIAEMSVQQLFRIRSINTNEIHLCTSYMGRTDYDIELQNIKKLISERDKCIVKGLPGIKFNCIKNEIIEDDYFCLFVNNKRKIYISRNNYNERLIELLKIQGIKNIKNVYGEKDKELTSKYRIFNKNNKEKLFDDIFNADDIDEEEAEILKKNRNINNEDYIKLKKYLFKNLYIIKDINKDKIKDFYGKRNIFNNLIEVFYNIKNFDEFINNKINEIHEENSNKNNIVRLHISKKHEKIALLVYFIKYIGYENIFDKSQIKIDDELIINFYKNYEKMFKYLFNAKMIDPNVLTLKNIIRYINERLKNLFGICIKKDKENKYTISGLEIWNKYEDISYNKKEIIDRYEAKELKIKEEKNLEKLINEIMETI
jgi:hypothetical protein